MGGELGRQWSQVAALVCSHNFSSSLDAALLAREITFLRDETLFRHHQSIHSLWSKHYAVLATRYVPFTQLLCPPSIDLDILQFPSLVLWNQIFFFFFWTWADEIPLVYPHPLLVYI